MDAFERRCLDAIQTLGKALGSLSLYKLGHPTVVAMIDIAHKQLTDAISQSPEGALALVVDQDKLIANGRIVGSLEQVPTSIGQTFERFKLASLTFRAGLETKELMAFLELASSRPDSADAAEPKAFMDARGVANLSLNEAVYVRGGEEAVNQALEARSIDETLKALVGSAVTDPEKQKKVYDRVRELLESDIQKRIDEVTRPLIRERNTAVNQATRATAVVENMADGVIVVDDEGKILMMNPAAEEIYSTTLAQSAGQPLHAQAGEEHLVSLAASINTPADHPIPTDVTIQAVEDTRRTLKSAAAVVQNEAGQVVGMVHSLADVAKQKELSRIQRDFVAHMTHELRAPLSSIRAALDILQEEFTGRLKEEETRIFSSALMNSDRLEKLINSILDFAKLEAGEMRVYPKASEPHLLAQEGVEGLRPWAARRNIDLSLSVEPQLPLVLADGQRVVQVLVNLLSNAIKFTPKAGKVSVRVSRHADSAARFVVFAVTDSGPGVPVSERERIFEKFIQVASGETHVGGTGLGLSIAKALVHMQGGRLWLESEVGIGSTFLFTVPIYVPPAGEVLRAPEAAPGKPEVPWWKKLLGLQ